MISKLFWSKVDVGNVDECWEWTAATRGRRKCFYGVFFTEGKRIGSHRYLMGKIHGEEYIKGKLVLHSCDNPLCVNPRHLTIGTHQENMDDMSWRNGNGRAPKLRYLTRKRIFNGDVESMIKKAQELSNKGCSPDHIATATGLDASLFG